MSQKLFIRADASAQIGTGHVMRCLSLAETWQRAGGRVTFFSANLPQALQQKLAEMKISLVPILHSPGSAEDCAFLAEHVRDTASWIVLDGYHFDASFQRQLKETGPWTLVVDDFGNARKYCADLVLDQNLGVTDSLYDNKGEQTRLLLGSRYVLLRQEFLKWRGRSQSISTVANKILVTLGGSDPDNATSLVLRALQETKIADLDVTIVVGGSNPHFETIKDLAATSLFKVRLLRGVSNMAELMAETDLAISASGTTSWELAFMGVPFATIVLAENQRGIAQQLEASGVSKNLGWHNATSPSAIARTVLPLLTDDATRAEMSRRGRNLIDGDGSFRVWLHLNEQMITLRNATLDDAKTILNWANQSDVRKVSFSQDAISWEKHLPWLETKLQSNNCELWIACDAEGKPIGQIRFDLDGDQATISISLDASARGKNFGPLVIWNGCRKLFKKTTVKSIDAFIKPDNAKSIRAFQKVGFKQAASKTVNGQQALFFQLWSEDLA